jgi:hypothetical protein
VEEDIRNVDTLPVNITRSGEATETQNAFYNTSTVPRDPTPEKRKQQPPQKIMQQ